jgi:hypothetical protein
VKKGEGSRVEIIGNSRPLLFPLSPPPIVYADRAMAMLSMQMPE